MRRTTMKSTRWPRFMGLCLAVVLGSYCLTDSAMAQSRRSSHVGFGGQLGDPAGVTLKFRNPGGVSYDFMAAWDSGDFFFLNVHGLWERHVGRHDNVHLFYGPGGYIGLRDRGRRDDESVIGISAIVGLGVILEQFELFGQLIPRLDLNPSTDGEVGIGVGVRYYF